MSLIVGENSYINLQDANNLLQLYFTSNHPMRVFWNSITEDSDKEAIILSATKKYDKNSMLYKWFKQDINQPLQFPRIDVNNNVIECPEDIKLGLLIQGIKENMMNEYAEYQQLKTQGIKSYKIKDASVEFFDSFDKNNIDTSIINNGMYKDVYVQYFRDYTDSI